MTTSYDVRRSDWLIVFGVGVYLCVTRASRTICVAILIAIAIGCVVAQSRSLISRSLASFLISIFAFGAINSQRALNDFADVRLGEYVGYATVISDPQNIGVATRTTLEIGRDRFVVYAYGRPAWRLAGAKVGEQVYVRGLREPFEQRTESRWVAQHIKGKFRLEFVGETRLVAPPILRSVQRVRDLVKLGSDSFEFDDQSLFTGLVIGDDTRQSKSMIDAFRNSGLAHLVAVSGQNVSFVLAALSPLLSRLKNRLRIFATLGVLVWFVLITRVEPSVVRAATMAGLAFLSVALGRPTRTMRLIALTVLLAVIVDPLLAWSVGFFMSIGATCGLCLGAAPLAKLVGRPKWLAQLIGATVAAQLGVMPVVILIFGVPSATGIIANVLAVPIAGLVMLVGLPMSLVAALIGNIGFGQVGNLLMLPIQVGVRWVWWVAEIFSRLRFEGAFNLALWIGVFVGIIALRHRSSSV
ncbi:MAG: ComEC/Rec2 family competence protein [Acidimicrobiaceae bacterium]